MDKMQVEVKDETGSETGRGGGGQKTGVDNMMEAQKGGERRQSCVVRCS